MWHAGQWLEEVAITEMGKPARADLDQEFQPGQLKSGVPVR
jgi:hypothetical protein